MKALITTLLAVLACTAQAVEPQRYRIDVDALRMSGRLPAQQAGDPVAVAPDVQRHSVAVEPLRMSGRTAQLPLGDPAPASATGTDVQRYNVEVAPLRMSGRPEPAVPPR